MGKEYLEKVEIGSGCFSQSKGVMKVMECVKLKHLRIGNDSCIGWSEFVMKDCGMEEIEIGDGCFVNCKKTTIMDLMELKELRIGKEVFRGRKNVKNELEMRNLNALSLMDADLKALMNVKIAVLVNMPLLKKLTLRAAFIQTEEGIVNNAGEFEKRKELKELEEWGQRVAVSSSEELESLEWHVREIVVGNGCCNKSVIVLDFKGFCILESIEIGDECFEKVNEVKLIGLNRLERVVIGENSFTKHKNSRGDDPNRHFYLKNCERVRELKMGPYSFSDYSVCEIENVPSLEVIEMGELNEWSHNFWYASLELKIIPSLKSLLFGGSAFYWCSRVVFENLPELTSIRLGEDAFRFTNDDSTELIMRNLPKLTSLTSEGSNSWTFQYPRSITLEDMPSLTTVTLYGQIAFKCKKTLHTKSPSPYGDRAQKNALPVLSNMGG
ncbi:hypothetical protein WA556_005561, partial [Blastocystis sp. ATCC 50177/Nand II]